MKIGLAVDVSELERRISRNPAKRILFAVVNAINATAKVVQRAIQLHGQDVFSIRKPGFILRQLAILKPFASVGQGRPYAEIAIGQKRNLLLTRFATGGLREPFTKGAKSVAVPVDARPSKQSSVPESLWVQRLGFKRPKALTTATRRARRQGTTGKTWEGRDGTYLIPGKGIFQRIGHGVSRVLYVFARAFRIRKVFLFVKTAQDIAHRVFAKNLAEEIRKALDFNRER